MIGTIIALIKEWLEGRQSRGEDAPQVTYIPRTRPEHYIENRSARSADRQRHFEICRRARVAKIFAGHRKGWKPPSAFSAAGRARIHRAIMRRK